MFGESSSLLRLACLFEKALAMLVEVHQAGECDLGLAMEAGNHTLLMAHD